LTGLRGGDEDAQRSRPLAWIAEEGAGVTVPRRECR